MSVSGELGDFDVASLLQILAMRRATGRLRLAVGGDEIAIYLNAGRLSAVASERLPFRLGRVLRQQGVISGAQLHEALRIQAQTKNPPPLGELLIARRWVTPQQIATCVQEQAIASLARALNAQKGSFSWAPGAAPSLREPTVGLDAKQTLIEAVRRVDELHRLRQHLLPQDAPLAVAAWADADMRLANDLEERIVGLLRAGIGSWGELVELLPVDEPALLRTLLSLQKRGLILVQTPTTDIPLDGRRSSAGALSEHDLVALLTPDLVAK